MINENLLSAVKQHVTPFIQGKISRDYAYHDLGHTKFVVRSTIKLAEHFNLSEKEKEIIEIAAWFHDIGYDQGQLDHELRSCQYVEAFLQQWNYPEEDIQKVVSCIMATRLPQNPKNLLEEIVCDADLGHLGDEYYWDRSGRLRQELTKTKNIIMSEQEWIDFEIDFLINHQYHTDIAAETFGKQKNKHIKQLRKQKLRLHPQLAKIVGETITKKKKRKKKLRTDRHDPKSTDLKELNLGRGVETMYRTTYRTHVNLSSIADNKANIMLSINAIIISIIVSSLVPRFSENTKLILPTIILLTVCLSALVFAILATRPKVTEGKTTPEDVANKSSNLLFFGNFFNMKLNDFHEGMMEMIKDRDFLYSSMTRDLYYLGIVLAKKYRYLRVCYAIFMYGLIISVVFFAIAFLI